MGRWGGGEVVDGESWREQAVKGQCQECATAEAEATTQDRSLRPHVTASVHTDLPAASFNLHLRIWDREDKSCQSDPAVGTMMAEEDNGGLGLLGPTSLTCPTELLQTMGLPLLAEKGETRPPKHRGVIFVTGRMWSH